MLLLQLPAPELGPDAGRQNLKIASGAHVVVGTGGQRIDHQLLVVVRAQQEQGDVAKFGHRLDPAAELEAVVLRMVRPVDAQQDAVHGLDRQQFQRFGAGPGRDHVVPLSPYPIGEQRGQ